MAPRPVHQLLPVEGFVSVLLPEEGAAMLTLSNRTSAPVRVPPTLRHRARPGARVVALVEGVRVLDWTLCD